MSHPPKLYSRYQPIQMGWSTASVQALLAEHSCVYTTEGSQTTFYYSAEDATRVMLASDAWLSANYAPRRSECYWPGAVRRSRGVPPLIPTWTAIERLASALAEAYPDAHHADLPWAGKQLAKQIERQEAPSFAPSSSSR